MTRPPCDNCGAEADAPTCPAHPVCQGCLVAPLACTDCINRDREWAADMQEDANYDHERDHR